MEIIPSCECDQIGDVFMCILPGISSCHPQLEQMGKDNGGTDEQKLVFLMSTAELDGRG